MRKGKKIVEQVTKEGLVIEDYDISLSSKELLAVISNFFPGIYLDKSTKIPSIFRGDYLGNHYAIRCKNVTYLGTPHPIYKKRIQIAEDFGLFINRAKDLNAKPILLGVYTYGENVVFVDFCVDTYRKKLSNNSSAHVYVSDIAVATEEKYFQKRDYFGNTITVFRADSVNIFLEELFSAENRDDWKNHVGVDDGKSEAEIQLPLSVDLNSDFKVLNSQYYCDGGYKGRIEKYASLFVNSIVPKISNFFDQEKKNWYGVECYSKMIEYNYRNKFQPEWVGFYLEYEFEKYIMDNNLNDVITYHQDKSDYGIDLDLFFPYIGAFGDLKAHSEDSRGIQGNDWDTIFSIICDAGNCGHVFYIVCEHSTKKDANCGYEVTRFWNISQHKNDLMSYHKRMKNSVSLKRVYFLDINYYNKQYLTMYRQGTNSNGKPRAPKIMIEQNNIKYFLISEIIF